MYFTAEYLINAVPESEKPKASDIARVVLHAANEDEFIEIAEEYVAGVRKFNNKVKLWAVRAS